MIKPHQLNNVRWWKTKEVSKELATIECRPCPKSQSLHHLPLVDQVLSSVRNNVAKSSKRASKSHNKSRPFSVPINTKPDVIYWTLSCLYTASIRTNCISTNRLQMVTRNSTVMHLFILYNIAILTTDLAS